VTGCCALIVFLFRFSLPESPRWLATHGQGERAIASLKRMGIPPPHEKLITDAPSNTRSDPIGVIFRLYRRRVIAGMVCFIAFFGVALRLGTGLPNMMAERGMTITKSLTYTFGLTLAFPCANRCMMFALERYGREPTSIVSFLLAGAFAVAFVNASSDLMLLAVGFAMIFFIQLAGNSMQIFASGAFPTNARASGFGFAQGAGRLGTAVIIRAILWIQTSDGKDAVFVFVAATLVIAAFTVKLLGPESCGVALDVLAPSTG
jgi:putative MFS transporter